MNTRNSAPLQGHYAGFVSRLIAHALDALVRTVSILIITWFFRLPLNSFQVESGTCPPFPSGPLSWNMLSSLACYAVALAFLVTVVLFVLLYPIVFWVLGGQTPGKAVMGVRVVRLDGRPIDLVTAVRRLLGYWVSSTALFLGYAWILVDDRRRGWHDRLAGTCVIYVWEARENEAFLTRVRSLVVRRQERLAARRQARLAPAGDAAEVIEGELVEQQELTQQ